MPNAQRRLINLTAWLSSPEATNDQLEHATNQAVPAEMEEDQGEEEDLLSDYAWEDGSA